LRDGDDISDSALPYHELLGSLYLAQGTRPDVVYAVSALGQYNTRYSKIHWACAKRMLRYLKGSIDYGLNYIKTKAAGISLDTLTPTGVIAASTDARTPGPSCQTLLFPGNQGNKKRWHSPQQKRNTLPSAKEAVYLSRFLSKIGFTTLSRISLHNDNQGARKLAVINPIFHSRSKHMDIRCHLIRQNICPNIQLTLPTHRRRK